MNSIIRLEYYLNTRQNPDDIPNLTYSVAISTFLQLEAIFLLLQSKLDVIWTCNSVYNSSDHHVCT